MLYQKAGRSCTCWQQYLPKETRNRCAREVNVCGNYFTQIVCRQDNLRHSCDFENNKGLQWLLQCQQIKRNLHVRPGLPTIFASEKKHGRNTYNIVACVHLECYAHLLFGAHHCNPATRCKKTRLTGKLHKSTRRSSGIRRPLPAPPPHPPNGQTRDHSPRPNVRRLSYC